jgi:hypothetical protein
MRNFRHTHVLLHVLVLQVESVLPDVNGEDGGMSSMSRQQMMIPVQCKATQVQGDSHSRRSWLGVVTISSFLAEQFHP